MKRAMAPTQILAELFMPKVLSSCPGIVDGSMITIDDFTQDMEVTITLRHISEEEMADMGEKIAADLFIVSGGVLKVSGEDNTSTDDKSSSATVVKESSDTPADDDDDVVLILEGDEQQSLAPQLSSISSSKKRSYEEGGRDDTTNDDDAAPAQATKKGRQEDAKDTKDTASGMEVIELDD